MATALQESAAPPLPVTTTVVEEGRTTAKTTAPQVALEPLVGAGLGGADVVMVPSNEDSALPPPASDHDVVISTVPEPSPVAGATSAEDVMDLVVFQYVDFPGIGTIDLDAPELPSNDREMLELVMKRMFAEPSTLDTITSVTSALRQYEGVGSSASPAAPEVAEGVFKESAADVESAVIMLAPSLTRDGRMLPCPSPQKRSHLHPLLRWPTWRHVSSARSRPNWRCSLSQS
jgi:hypothetical protein